MSIYDFDIHAEADEEFDRLIDVNGQGTRQSAYDIGEILARIKKWVRDGVPDKKYPLWGADGITGYSEGENSVLAFFAVKGKKLVLVKIDWNGNADEQSAAKDEAKRRAKEWFDEKDDS